ncbi:hypothetical protein PSPO01_11796 [Paraphaeosphaeria sporulosa]
MSPRQPRTPRSPSLRLARRSMPKRSTSPSPLAQQFMTKRLDAVSCVASLSQHMLAGIMRLKVHLANDCSITSRRRGCATIDVLNAAGWAKTYVHRGFYAVHHKLPELKHLRVVDHGVTSDNAACQADRFVENGIVGTGSLPPRWSESKRVEIRDWGTEVECVYADVADGDGVRQLEVKATEGGVR